ncbi:MAG: hypothetical protein FJ147_14960 [Deltaproteobacteria bacterium]|nr:hypothetical protein [Deltaproteobacteria bacterium]
MVDLSYQVTSSAAAPRASTSPVPPRVFSLADLLQPNYYLPEQCFALPNVEQSSWLPQLMRAILEDAVQCYQLRHRIETRPSARQLTRDAERWLFSNDDASPLSFHNVCTVLGLEPRYLQRGLRQWTSDLPTPPWKRKRRLARGFRTKVSPTALRNLPKP